MFCHLESWLLETLKGKVVFLILKSMLDSVRYSLS